MDEIVWLAVNTPGSQAEVFDSRREIPKSFPPMANPLVIVESPAKARTIAGYLAGADVVDGSVAVEASIGHVRDLPRNAKDVPDAYKGEAWARLGIDVENDFKPLYIVSPEKKDVIRKLKALLKSASELYLATDEDREGEAIAWHLLEVLNPPASMPVKRMVFHEITPAAIREAIQNPRDIDRRLVDAQETRRLLDRLYGYEVSPVLWKKVAAGTSAGRVQSVGTRLVVERERERMRFVSASYWDLEGEFAKRTATGDDARSFTATLVQLDGKRLATGKDFNESGQVSRADLALLDEPQARTLATELETADFSVRSVERRPYRRRPSPPFMTSTFQQEAGRKLRLSSAMAMRAAQSLYEGGYITYMRTDSTTLSETAVAAARSEISRRYGSQYLPDQPRQYTRKVKNAQEAHEAIRPAGDTFRTPAEVAAEVNRTDARVYEMIWKRTIASQMTDAVGETVTVRLGAVSTSGRDVEFATSGTIITHQGFRLVYIEDVDEGDSANGDDSERRLPALAERDPVDVERLEANGHETQPPPRYTEASLVKRLEELGVGRPSTYASIIKTIQDRGYVWKKGSALVPSFTAFAVVGLLEQHFPDIIDYAFTARMEDDLDSIAGGNAEMVPYLRDFYFGLQGDSGERHGGLKEMVDGRLDEIDAANINTIPIGLDPEGVLIVAKPGKTGSPYLMRGSDTASIPDNVAPDELTVDRALELLAAPKGGRELGTDPETGMPVFAKSGRFGPYVQLGDYDETGKTKPKMSSLFQTMTVEGVTLDEALQLLSLPRVVGVDPGDGAEITAQNGRFGPYVQKDLPDDKKDSRSLASEDQLLTVTLDEALALFAQPRTRRGAAPKPPMRTLGNDAESGKPMVIKDGRFGPYVTDGETNASLRKHDDVETITDERASELLADRRARGPVKKKATARKATTKKTSAKKATAKKTTAKKTTAKKKATARTATTKKTAAKKATTRKSAAGRATAAPAVDASDPGPGDGDFSGFDDVDF
jgi:DNA topoisomerase I